MKIDRATLEKIAHLARLELDEKEVPKLLEDMSRMISFVEKLKEVDTAGVEPLTTMSHEINAVREDKIKNQLSTDDVLKNAPDQEGSYFRVPKVIE
ncbi:MAG TPA: Asp-tRNA(Asn)/Glu-tRNA(Gln) amidotransferase subunit GatC [Cyclobacteriaceae bacterium]|nr:Asp-tRNA(Asn)/Glu-tRNA(Gln) amidotransferase subunit GatC [Cyclobacteriaceae bacterium]